MAIKNQKVAEEQAPVKVSFLEKNIKKIAAVVVAALVVVIGIFAYVNFVKGPKEDKASTMLAKSQEVFAMAQQMGMSGQDSIAAANYDKALNGEEGFLKVIEQYSGTKAGNLAQLYAGLCYANTEKWEEAEKYLDKFSTSDDAMVSPAAVAARGNVKAQLGKLDEAVKDLKKAASMADKQSVKGANMSLSATFLFQAAQILQSQGKNDEALALCNEIKDKYAGSGLVQYKEVDKFIEMLEQTQK